MLIENLRIIVTKDYYLKESMSVKNPEHSLTGRSFVDFTYELTNIVNKIF